MSLRDKIREYLGTGAKATTLPASGRVGWSPILWGNNLQHGDQNDESLVKTYAKVDLVYACVTEIATSFIEAPLMVVDEDDEEIENHAALNMFNNNRLMSEADIFRLLIQRLELTGLAFGMLERFRNVDGFGGYIPIPTQFVSIKSEGPILTGYAIQRDGDPLEIGPDEGVAVMLVDPAKYIGYVSPLKAAIGEVGIDRERQNITGELLVNRNVPGIIAEHDEVLSEDQREQLRNSLNAATGGGTASRGKAIVLPAGVHLAEPVRIDDIDFQILTTMTETRICMVFGVPPIIVGAKAGIDRSTYANYEEARESFYSETVLGLWKFVADSLSRQILWMEPFRYKFDTSQIAELQEGKKETAEAAVSLFGGGIITKNEARTMLELDDVPDGEEFKAPPPTPMIGMAAQPADKPDEEDDGKTYEQFVADKLRKAMSDAGDSDYIHDRYSDCKCGCGSKARAAIGFFDESGPMTRALTTEFNAQEKFVLKEVRGGKLSFLPDEIGGTMAESIGIELAGLYEKYAKQMINRVTLKTDNVVQSKIVETLTVEGIGVVEAELLLVIPQLRDAWEAQTFDFARSVNGTTSTALTAKLASLKEELAEIAITGGNTIPLLTKAVKEVFTTATDSRARMIAITESSRATHDAQVMAAPPDIVRGFKTLISADACPICQVYVDDMPTGVAVWANTSLAQAQAQTGSYSRSIPPFHPNCRCTFIEDIGI